MPDHIFELRGHFFVETKRIYIGIRLSDSSDALQIGDSPVDPLANSLFRLFPGGCLDSFLKTLKCTDSAGNIRFRLRSSGFGQCDSRYLLVSLDDSVCESGICLGNRLDH